MTSIVRVVFELPFIIYGTTGLSLEGDLFIYFCKWLPLQRLVSRRFSVTTYENKEVRMEEYGKRIPYFQSDVTTLHFPFYVGDRETRSIRYTRRHKVSPTFDSLFTRMT